MGQLIFGSEFSLTVRTEFTHKCICSDVLGRHPSTSVNRRRRNCTGATHGTRTGEGRDVKLSGGTGKVVTRGTFSRRRSSGVTGERHTSFHDSTPLVVHFSSNISL